MTTSTENTFGSNESETTKAQQETAIREESAAETSTEEKTKQDSPTGCCGSCS